MLGKSTRNISLNWKLILPVPAILVAGLFAAWIVIPQAMIENSIAAATLAAERTVGLRTVKSRKSGNIGA